MMQMTTINDDGAIHIPDDLRDALGLYDGVIVSIEAVGETLVLQRAAVTPAQAVAFYQDLARQRALTPSEEDEAFGLGVAANFEQEQGEGRYSPPPATAPRIRPG